MGKCMYEHSMGWERGMYCMRIAKGFPARITMRAEWCAADGDLFVSVADDRYPTTNVKAA